MPIKTLLPLLFLLFAICSSIKGQYCPGIVGNECDISAIRRFTFSNINNNNNLCDKDFYDTTQVLDGYSDYTNMTVVIKPNTAYEVSVQLLNALISDVAAFWVDWNVDQTWSEDEMYQMVGNDFTVGLYKAVVVAPPSAVEGVVGRIRVIGDFTEPPVDPCASTYSGEIEDYSFIVADSTAASADPSYCPPLIGNECDIDAIKRFTVANLDNDNNLCDKDQPDTTQVVDGYSDYTDMVATFRPDSTYLVTAEIYSSQILDQAMFWVDWNRDGIWSESERYQMTGNGFEVNLFTATITVPPTAVIGQASRIRVIGDFFLPVTDPCAQTYSGEIEDYSFIILNPSDTLPQCVDETQVTPQDDSIDLCTHQILRWPKATKANRYMLSLRNTASGAYLVQNLSISDTFYIVASQLDPSTTYRWIAKAMNDDIAAVGCDSSSFTTGPADPTSSIQLGDDSLEVCQNSILSLTSNTIQGTAPYNHSWSSSKANAFNDASLADPAFTSDSAGSYIVYHMVMDDHGCSSLDSAVITVHQEALAGVLSMDDAELCLNDDALVELSGANGDITWQDSVSNGTWAAAIPVLTSGGYTFSGLTETVWIRCAASSTICSDTSGVFQVTVHPLPDAPTVSLSGRDSLCPGETSTLSVNNYSSGLLWNDGDSTSAASLTVIKGGMYQVIYTDSNNCQSSAEFEIFDRIPAEKPAISIMTPLPHCEGQSVTLNASGTSISWNDPAMSTGNSISVTDGGLYTATATSPDGCVSSSDPAEVSFSPVPSTPAVAQAGDSLITADSASAYYWFDASGNLLDITSSPFFAPSAEGYYALVVVSIEGCSSDTSDYFYFTPVSTGITETRQAALRLFPNPVSQELNIICPEILHPEMLYVFDAWGKLVIAEKINSNKFSISLSLKSGIYSVLITGSGKSQNGSFVVE